MKLKPEEIDLVRQLIAEKESGKKELLDQLLYKEQPVGMEEFIRGENYLNRNDIWPRVCTICKYIDHPDVHRAFLYLGKGSGKTTISAVTLARGAYTFGCYREPRAVFQIGDSSVVALLNLSTSRDQANMAVFGELKAMLARSPWFRNRCEILTNKIRFEGDYYALCGNSGAMSWEGLNVYCGVIDEINKLRDVRGKLVGEKLFELLISQAETRFPDHYKILAVSSAGDGKGYLDKVEAEIQERKPKSLSWSELEISK